MIKKILICTALISFSMSSYAAQCPLYSDWQHTKGQPWQLTKVARDAGWRVKDYSFVNRDETSVPPGHELRVRISKWSLSGDWVYCEYALGTGTYATLTIAENVMHDVLRREDGSIDSRGIFNFDSWGVYVCHTHTNTPQNCNWSWERR